jgi:hypothetical protein
MCVCVVECEGDEMRRKEQKKRKRREGRIGHDDLFTGTINRIKSVKQSDA